MHRSGDATIRDWVLVVDDDPYTRDSLGLLLQTGGYTVETAASGRAAIAAMERRAWDAVLLDMQLPDIPGTQVLRAIASTWPGTPVIVLTGHGSLASAIQAVNAAAFAYLEKPVDPDRLLRTLSRALQRTRLDDARRRLAALVESSDDAITANTLEGVIVSWNAGAERLYGHRAEDVLGRTIGLVMPPDHPDELPTILARLRRGERIEPFDTARVRKDGSRVEVSLTVSPIRDAMGAIVGFSGIARDITARKRAEETTRALIQVTHELVGTLDLAQVTERIAVTVARLLRVRRATLLRAESGASDLVCVAVGGDGDRDAWIGRRLASADGIAGRAIALGRPVWAADLREEPPHAVPGWLRERFHVEGLGALAAAPLVDHGETLGALTLADPRGRVFTDADLRVLAAFADHAALAIRNARLHDEVRRGRDFLRSITENSADAIVTTDVHGRLTYVSPGATKMFGYETAEVVGQPAADYYRQGRADGLRVLRRLRAHGEIRDHETAIRAKDGRWVPVSASFALLRDAEQGIVGMLAVVRDMSERAAAESARRELDQLRAVTLLAGGVAHEINNPLAVVVGQLELFAMRRAPDDPDARRLAQALAAALEIKNIVARLPQIGRIATTFDPGLPSILDLRRATGAA